MELTALIMEIQRLLIWSRMGFRWLAFTRKPATHEVIDRFIPAHLQFLAVDGCDSSLIAAHIREWPEWEIWTGRPIPGRDPAALYFDPKPTSPEMLFTEPAGADTDLLDHLQWTFGKSCERICRLIVYVLRALADAGVPVTVKGEAITRLGVLSGTVENYTGKNVMVIYKFGEKRVVNTLNSIHTRNHCLLVVQLSSGDVRYFDPTASQYRSNPCNESAGAWTKGVDVHFPWGLFKGNGLEEADVAAAVLEKVRTDDLCKHIARAVRTAPPDVWAPGLTADEAACVFCVISRLDG